MLYDFFNIVDSWSEGREIARRKDKISSFFYPFLPAILLNKYYSNRKIKRENDKKMF
jgi:hypothetical protein